LSHISPDGDQGFPGEVKVEVRYQFSEDLTWRIEYKATTSQATPINLTQHAYFNLEGAGKGSVANHEIELKALHYTPVNEQVIPTGEIRPVEGSEFDFRQLSLLKERFEQGFEYDHNMVLPTPTSKPQCAAIVKDRVSQRRMELWTTEPAFQFYTANFLDGSLGNSIGKFQKHSGFCLEAQNFPDAVHHKNFPNSILEPGQTYSQVTEYRFR
jgi:aldose 1-epimerase